MASLWVLLQQVCAPVVPRDYDPGSMECVLLYAPLPWNERATGDGAVRGDFIGCCTGGVYDMWVLQTSGMYTCTLACYYTSSKQNSSESSLLVIHITTKSDLSHHFQAFHQS